MARLSSSRKAAAHRVKRTAHLVSTERNSIFFINEIIIK